MSRRGRTKDDDTAFDDFAGARRSFIKAGHGGRCRDGGVAHPRTPGRTEDRA